MINVLEGGAYLINGTEIIPDTADASTAVKSKTGKNVSKEEAKKGTIAYGILESHNTSGNMEKLKIKFDKLTSHDITFVGIIQTARASGLEKFPVPYVLTNCHNSLCAVGGTINEDDHMFGLTCAKKYGGVYVPPHQAVIHQYAREMLAGGGKMILGSDSHTRYGALGTMAMGEGGPELVKQLLNQTYDINMPGVVGVYLTGEPVKGVGPQDVALAIIGEVFASGYVKNKVMEFVGPGVSSLSADFRIGIDVMTTETTCLSSIWRTDDEIKNFYDIHGRSGDYKELNPGEVAYYDGMIIIDLSTVKPMIAMPFHPSNTYTIEELNANLMDILDDVEKKAAVSLDGAVDFTLKNKVKNGKLMVDQGIIAGCAGGGFENICAAAEWQHTTTLTYKYRKWLQANIAHNYIWHPIYYTIYTFYYYNGDNYHNLDATLILSPKISIWQPTLTMSLHKQWNNMPTANGVNKLSSPSIVAISNSSHLDIAFDISSHSPVFKI